MPVIPSELTEAPEPRESEYGPDGLFKYGPQRARPITARLAALTLSRSPEAAPPPNVARAQARIKRERARSRLTRRERFMAATLGWPVGRVSASRAA